MHELGLLNFKFILVCKAKFSSKFNYIDFIFLRNLSVVVKKILSDRTDLALNLIIAGFYILNLIKKSLQAQNELGDCVLAREAGLKLISGWTCFVRPNLSFKFHVLISVDEKIAHYRF